MIFDVGHCLLFHLGLICSDDHDRVEACLKSAENLVRSNSEAVREVIVCSQRQAYRDLKLIEKPRPVKL